MPIETRLSAGASRLHELLLGGYRRASIDQKTLSLRSSARKPPADIPVRAIISVEIRRSFSRRHLVIRTSDGQRHVVGNLQPGEAAQLAQDINDTAESLQPQATALIDELTTKAVTMFDGSRYIRRSEADTFLTSLIRGLDACKGLVANALTARSRTNMDHLQTLAQPASFELARSRRNRVFTDREALTVQQVVRDGLGAQLTDEQAAAIATDEDSTLVLAGAGTGKTAVIVGKAVHLVRNQGVDPAQILILAFNRQAAEEIQERLPSGLDTVHVSTFHAFGRHVIAESDVAPSISRLATDQFAYRRAIEGVIHKLLKDPGRSGIVLKYIAYPPTPFRSPFGFNSVEEYRQYIRNVELRTLNGTLVKSFEELVIANYLTEHGVDFSYERPYSVATATKQHSQYRPDFYLHDNDIYIEHFALDRQERPPPGWDTYAEGVAWKRGLHAEHGTNLIETYSWQHSEGKLVEFLQRRLQREGVKMEQLDSAELLTQLAEQHVSKLATILSVFLTHAKGAGLSLERLRALARKSRDSSRAKGFIEVYGQAASEYERLLQKEQAVDFHDLLNCAARLIDDRTWEPPFEYVLVDEFQDISAGRMRLLKALNHPGVAYFLVGDDWQSIYRFAGSDVQLMRNCRVHLGHTEERPLSRTFRFGKEILDPSSVFVQANPEQTRRDLRPADVSDDRGITIVADSTPSSAFLSAIGDIDELVGGDDQATVLVLGRYQKTIRALSGRPRNVSGKLTVSFSTIHQAKGQEADYVIVLDLTNKISGFPSRIEDDPLMEMVLPPVTGKAFPVAEERRLFYVALTRARVGVYLAANTANPSEFVTELLALYPRLRQIGRAPLKCPRCSHGFLSPSKSERTLGCSNRPHCKIQVALCPGCNVGHVLVENGKARCLNPACSGPGGVCPKCGKGILLSRRGPSGPFWACTEYWMEPPCRYTRPIRRRGQQRQRQQAH